MEKHCGELHAKHVGHSGCGPAGSHNETGNSTLRSSKAVKPLSEGQEKQLENEALELRDYLMGKEFVKTAL